MADAGMATTGITLAGVKALRNKVLAYNARSPRAPIVRTADIAARVIKPETAGLPQGGRAYVQTDGGRHSGKPSYFVCHAWQSDAVGFLEAIIGHGVGVVRRGGASPVYYLDLACVDQHQTDQVHTCLSDHNACFRHAPPLKRTRTTDQPALSHVVRPLAGGRDLVHAV